MRTILPLVLFFYVKAQWIQLNLDSKNDFYLNALSAGDSYMRKSQSKNEDISRVALYTMNESYNQRFKVVYSKRNSDKSIKFSVIEMYCGKSTSGMFKVGQTYMYDDENEVKIANKLYSQIQNIVIYKLKENDLTFKYIKNIRQIESVFFIVEVVTKEQSNITLIANLDDTDVIRIPIIYK